MTLNSVMDLRKKFKYQENSFRFRAFAISDIHSSMVIDES